MTEKKQLLSFKNASFLKRYSFLTSSGFARLLFLWLFTGAASAIPYDMELWFLKTFSEAQNGNSFLLSGGIMVFAGFFCAVGVGPITGRLVDYFKNYKKPILFFLSCLALSAFVLYPFLHSFWALFVGMGITFGICYSYRNLIDPLATIINENNEMPFGITRGVYSIGFGISSLLVTWIIAVSAPGSSIIFFVYGSVLLILLIYILIFIKEPIIHPLSHGHDISNPQIKAKAKNKLFSNKIFWIGLIIFFIVLGSNDVFDHLSNDTITANHWNQSLKGQMDIAKIPTETIAFTIGSIVLINLDIKKSLILAIVLSIVMWLCLGGASSHKWSYFITGAILFPFVSGLIIPIPYEYFTSISFQGQRGIAITFMNGICYGLGSAFFTMITAVMFQATIPIWIFVILASTNFIALIIAIIFVPKNLSLTTYSKEIAKDSYTKKELNLQKVNQ